MLVSGPNQKTLTAAALTDSVKAAYTWLRGELRSAGILADSRPAFVQYPSNETNQHLFVKVTELVKASRCLIDWVVQHVADHANPATDIDEKVRVSDEDEIARRLGMKLVTPEVSPLTTFEEHQAGFNNLGLFVAKPCGERVLRMNPGLVTETDTTVKWLWDQLDAGDNITLTLLNSGGNEQVQIAATAGSGSTWTLFNPGFEKASATLAATELAAGTTTVVVTTDFGFTAADVDAVLLRIKAHFTSDTIAGWDIDVAATGASVKDAHIELASWATTNSAPPLTGNVNTDERNETAVVRCDSSKQITYTIAGTGTGGCGFISVWCLGYLSGATWSN